MRVAALDLGSNTSLLLIADVSGDSQLKVLSDQTTITRLGQGVHAHRRFHPDALARMEACLAQYAADIKKWNCEKVVAVATSAARDVANGQSLIEIGQKHGIPIHIISGEREAQLTFRGALCDRASCADIAVVDVGGGSTEIILRHQGHVAGTSVDVGSVRLTEMFIHSDPAGRDEVAKLQDYVRAAFARAPLPAVTARELVAVAGTPTTLAGLEQKVDFSEQQIHGYNLSVAQMEAWAQRLAQLSLAGRADLPGMPRQRADVILAGTLILCEAMRRLKQNQITVSTRGVRYGVALSCSEF